MSITKVKSRSKLRILHCFLDPKEQSFRNVRDIIYEQCRLGYDVGFICSNKICSPDQEEELLKMSDSCSLGSKRISIRKQHGLKDVANIRSTRKFAQKIQANIIHGHGYKAGIYARFAAGKLRKLGLNASAYYSPHFTYDNQNKRLNFTNLLSRSFERKLSSLSQGIIFHSNYSTQTYVDRIGEIPCQYRVITNGLLLDDFSEREHDIHAADFLFYGDLTQSEGPDIFIEALSGITVQTPVTAAIIGTGPEKQALEKQADKLGILNNIVFIDNLPQAEAYRKGRCYVIPAKDDIETYRILEASASEVPLIATDVGCMSELIEGTSIKLVPAGDVISLRQRMEDFLLDPIPCEVQAELFAEHIGDKYKIDRMVDELLELYFSYT